jgi:hypothetical protein
MFSHNRPVIPKTSDEQGNQTNQQNPTNDRFRFHAVEHSDFSKAWKLLRRIFQCLENLMKSGRAGNAGGVMNSNAWKITWRGAV